MTVLGTGYLGATHAVCMAELGFEVLGVDVDETRSTRLAAGDVPFFEPELPELLRKNLASGRLRFTTSFEEVGEFGDVHFVCVGTPQKQGRVRRRSHLRRRGFHHAGAAPAPALPGGGQVDCPGRDWRSG